MHIPCYQCKYEALEQQLADYAWLKADHSAMCEIINGIDDADLTYKEGDSINVKALKDFIRLTNAKIAELELKIPRNHGLVK
jgi:hypothetical protein